MAHDPKYLMRLGLYDSWDAKMGLENAEDTREYRVQRFQAMQKKVSDVHQKFAENPALTWDDARPKLKWDQAAASPASVRRDGGRVGASLDSAADRSGGRRLDGRLFGAVQGVPMVARYSRGAAA